jgi:hypothetical protein
MWKSSNILFTDTKGPYYKNDWHMIEVYIKLNSITNGKAIRDGVLQYWIDNTPVTNHNNVVFRTGQHPDMKFNQFIIGPYIGVGSPVDQTFWVDNPAVATEKVNDAPWAKLSPPKHLRVITAE